MDLGAQALSSRTPPHKEDESLLSSKGRGLFRAPRSTSVQGDGDANGIDQSIYTRSRSGKRPKMAVDSLDFEQDESRIWRAQQSQRQSSDRGKYWTRGKKRALARWALTFFIGMMTGLLAVAITTTTLALSEWKFSVVHGLVDSDGFFTAFLAYWALNLLFTLVASLCAVLEPLAAGSGIPEIKCYLNGIALPRVVRFKTLLCKAFGVTFTVASGLPAGKEGPMVHSGAVVAAGVSQGKSTVLGVNTSCARVSDFRNDREKRDFVACGAAAGVAAAFGAPIGGVLFSLEEGASFWSTRLTWRAFFCAMMTVLTLYIVRSAEYSFGKNDNTSMFSFGEFYSLQESRSNYSVWELILFIVLGAMGGLMGAAFNAVNRRISVWRAENVQVTQPLRRVGEALAITTLMTCVSFGLSAAWVSCTEKPVATSDWTKQETDLLNTLVSFGCDKETEYNELASLFMAPADNAIKQLFHFQETGDTEANTFSSGALFLFLMPYILMGCVTYGVAVPSGLFVPSLLSGAALGRLVGHLLHLLDNSHGTFADSGTYALIGAASMLGGMARMTISLTVILLEATGDMQYVVPLMLALMTARWVGNIFNEGLYDIHIHLRGLPFLEETVPQIVREYDLDVEKVMAQPVRHLREVVTVEEIFICLTSCEHDCFPVVHQIADSAEHVVGTVQRRVLSTVLECRAFNRPSAVGGDRSALVTQEMLARLYPRYPIVEDMNFTTEELMCTVDLRPYLNCAPFIVRQTASVERAYRLFRTLGLRHLIVVDDSNSLVGMLTRKDLLSHHIVECLREDRAANGQRSLQRPSEDLDAPLI